MTGAVSPLSEVLRGAKEVKPPELRREVTDLPPIARAGVELAKLVLWFIAIAALLLLIFIGFEEFGSWGPDTSSIAMLVSKLAAHPPNLTDASQRADFQQILDSTKALLTALDAEKQSARDFVMKVCQLILVSIFLPILTALLGYIFGTQQSSTTHKGGE